MHKRPGEHAQPPSLEFATLASRVNPTGFLLNAIGEALHGGNCLVYLWPRNEINETVVSFICGLEMVHISYLTLTFMVVFVRFTIECRRVHY